MPISQSSNNNPKGILDINAEDYYFKTLRPYMQDMMRLCKTDEELYRTLDKVVNASDTFCTKKQFTELIDTYSVLQKAITDKSYFITGPMKRGTEEEKQMIRDLSSKISDFIMIVKYEPEPEIKKPANKDRLNYKPATQTSPIGENEDFITHNMSNLNIPQPKNRIPNV